MIPKRHRAHPHSAKNPAVILPPDLRVHEGRPFTPGHRQALRAWLTEEGWPRGTMDIAMLEGYLVAMLAWPVGIACGAWLPPIWGEKSGWRVPAKISEPEAFNQFIELVVGFLQNLDSALDSSPSNFTPTLLPDEKGRRGPRVPGVSWAQGFVRALHQNAQGLQGRSIAARSALSAIAGYATFEVGSSGTDSAVAAKITSGVLTLVAERASRGPLGELETNAVPLDFTPPSRPSRSSAKSRATQAQTPEDDL